MRASVLLLAVAWGVAAQTTQVAVAILPSDGATGVPLNARVLAAVPYPGTYYVTIRSR